MAAAEQSPPSRGAWIEIDKASAGYKACKSPPSRGAWIEIVWGVNDMAAQIESPPSRGAWIEILTTWS